MTSPRLSRGLAIAACGAAMLLTAVPTPAQESTRAISYADSFPIGSNGLCEAQILPPEAGAGLFDRSYAIVCRDAAAPVGKLWGQRNADLAEATTRLLPDADCQAADSDALPDLLGAGTSAACTDPEMGTRRVFAAGEMDGRLYAGEAITAYADAVRLGLVALAQDRLVEGNVEIPLTESDDAVAFARACVGV